MRAAYLVALLAMLGFLTAPAGFMPARAADGSFELQLCPTTSPAARALLAYEASQLQPKAQSHHTAMQSAHGGHGGHEAHRAHQAHKPHHGESSDAMAGDHSGHHSGHSGGEGDAAASDSPCDYGVAGHASAPPVQSLAVPAPMAALRAENLLTPITGIFPDGLPPATGPPVS